MIAAITVAGIVAALYAAGVLITNLYLYRLGFFQFVLVQDRYVTVGLAFALVIAAASVRPLIDLPRVSAWADNLESTTTPGTIVRVASEALLVVLVWLQAMITAAVTIGLLVMALAGPATAITLMSSIAAEPQWLVALVIAAFAAVSLWSEVASGRFTNGDGVIAAAALAAAIYAVVGYASVVFPALPQSFGGGMPSRALIYPKADVAPSLKAAFGEPRADGAWELGIVDQNESEYLITWNSSGQLRVGTIARDQIDVLIAVPAIR